MSWGYWNVLEGLRVRTRGPYVSVDPRITEQLDRIEPPIETDVEPPHPGEDADYGTCSTCGKWTKWNGGICTTCGTQMGWPLPTERTIQERLLAEGYLTVEEMLDLMAEAATALRTADAELTRLRDIETKAKALASQYDRVLDQMLRGVGSEGLYDEDGEVSNAMDALRSALTPKAEGS